MSEKKELKKMANKLYDMAQKQRKDDRIQGALIEAHAWVTTAIRGLK